MRRAMCKTAVNSQHIPRMAAVITVEERDFRDFVPRSERSMKFVRCMSLAVFLKTVCDSGDKLGIDTELLGEVSVGSVRGGGMSRRLARRRHRGRLEDNGLRRGRHRRRGLDLDLFTLDARDHLPNLVALLGGESWRNVSP